MKKHSSLQTWSLIIALAVSVILHFVVAGIESPTQFTTGQAINFPKGHQPFVDADDTFRVATYNIQRSKGKDGKRDIKRTASVFNEPDIVALQEVAGTLFYGLDNQAKQIADQLKLGWLYAPSMMRWYQPYKGNALLSRFELNHWSIEPLPRDASNKKLRYRNLITASVTIKGREVTLLATHIARRDDAMRAFVIERFQQTQGPVILMGDLNATFEHEQIKNLLADKRNTDAVEATIGPFWRLDWIITRGFNVVDGGYTPRGISDHAHYWVDLSFSEDEDALKAQERTNTTSRQLLGED